MIVLSIHAPYKGQVSQREEKLPYQTIELPDFYSGKNKWLRLIGNLIDGFRLVVYSMLLPQHQLKVVLTDPSLINAWAVLFRPFYRSKLVFWTMDLYPGHSLRRGCVMQSSCVPDNLFFCLSSCTGFPDRVRRTAVSLSVPTI